MRIRAFATMTLVSICLMACATSFSGSPYVENGRAGCEAKCRSVGMEVAGIVYMGEYSDACVCSVPGRAASRSQLLDKASAAIAGAGAGVAMQMQRQRSQNSTMH
jgi:hypothetical protein